MHSQAARSAAHRAVIVAAASLSSSLDSVRAAAMAWELATCGSRGAGPRARKGHSAHRFGS